MTELLPPHLTADNRPGSPTCPPWLFLLDDPAPAHVRTLGGHDPAAARWFAEAGATWSTDAATDVGSGEAGAGVRPPIAVVVAGPTAG